MGDRGNSFTQFNFILALIDGDYESWKLLRFNVENYGGKNLRLRFDDRARIKHVSVDFTSYAAVLNSIVEACLFCKEQGFTQKFIEWSDDRHETVKKVKREMEELLA